MTADMWLPIRYRDFYDIPRAVLVEYKGDVYFLNSPFDEQADDYQPHYDVYRLNPGVADRLPDSWEDLNRHGELIGRVGTTDVEFDTSRRREINARVFALIGSA